ncbi:putative glycerol kinase 5 isoform X2 [Tribolium castaneum]|uniref:putative glycerol kinase 5 isoform X2 n=1 Tax=Tribolium castaneum TaxID=7070 RepID=UPI00077DDA2A|nr:PREDICTED: putative glycerol kinase 5 isoform X2 [Tribolium castaneum]|eukprot:XP_015836816.1 PREDICTED: putative glycerol kinase 5 isoform X2 [Tribolium castaneum]
MGDSKMPSNDYVASLDIGTTTIRCTILNSLAQTVGSARSTVSRNFAFSTNQKPLQVKLIYPEPGFVEINPDQLWEQILEIIKNAVSDANLDIVNIKCLGISTQRSTFLTWDSQTGKPFHNFITWKDIRAKNLCKELNSSFLVKAFRCAAYSLYLVTRSNRFLIGSRLKFAANHATGRLLWVLQNNPVLKTAVSEHNAKFGTIDTWLLHKLTKNKLHVTDISNASATGFFDPFVFEWGSWAKVILGIPMEILPQVVPNDYDFGSTEEKIFGVSIPIRCIMADQSSSMFASSCFVPDDIKLTLGTGAFLDVNTAGEIHTSVTGIYPLVAWKIKNEVTCIGEVACNDCGSLIQWLLNIGLVTKPSDIYGMVTGVEDSDGVYFIPAFSGLGPPINDEKASSGFLGIKPTTTKNHLVRSVLEGITYRAVLAFQTLKKERNREYYKVTVDGGVSNNDFVCQLFADLTGIEVERLDSTEMSVLGVGFLAGIIAGVWKTNEEIKKFNKVQKLFSPTADHIYRKRCFEEFNKWRNAVERFKYWYEED